MNILESLTTVASGGVFGLIGSVTGYVSKYLQKRQDQKFELKKLEFEERLYKLNMQAKAEETENELKILEQKGSWGGLSDSLKTDSKLKPVSGWARDCKSLFRPVLTVLLWVIASWVFYKIIQDKVFDPLQTKELIKYMVHSIFFAASTATVWWFGDRSLRPK